MIEEIENEVDKNIILEILQKLNIKYCSHKYFNDSVSSRVILLNDKYLIKQNTKLVLQYEIDFLKLYTDSVFQKIIYVHPDYKYVVYEFIPGDTMKIVDNADDTIKKLISITFKYKTYSNSKFGYLDKPSDSWEEFLIAEILSSSKNISADMIDKSIPLSYVDALKNFPFNTKLLHGDFGTHNFIKRDGKLVGIIDPMPVVGDYLYDLLFAFTSNIGLLKCLPVSKIFELINESKEKILSMLIIVLYSRISRCLKYHPNDINFYLDYWNDICLLRFS